MKSNEHENTNIESDYSSKHFPAEKLLEDNDQDFDDCRVIIEANTPAQLINCLLQHQLNHFHQNGNR